jgi:hypothetical protein
VAPVLIQQNNFMTGEGNVPGAATGNFWPIAAIQPQLRLATVPDPQYTADSPQPFQLRSFGATGPRLIGALQATP